MDIADWDQNLEEAVRISDWGNFFRNGISYGKTVLFYHGTTQGQREGRPRLRNELVLHSTEGLYIYIYT